MLYLFGQLALSDSLFYHENFDQDDYPAAVAASGPTKSEVGARPIVVSQRRHREHHLAPADRTATNQQD